MKSLERWIKLFLPAPNAEAIEEFKGLVRLVHRYGYGVVMLELGGAMEYHSHPEINEGWREFTADMREFPGKTHKILEDAPWEKNVIHLDNGGGDVLSQVQIRELVAYCQGLGLEVVPEVPCLSHSDYILTRHPEMAERQEDRYPDAACPNHPGYFPLICDILAEVCEVFRPRRVNICHDELYTMCLCPRCRDCNPAELYAMDINRCADFLKSKGVGTIIWGEKLLNSHLSNGEACGGAGRPPLPNKESVAPLYQCAELLHKDIEMLHWHWPMDKNNDLRYGELGMDFYFGNFTPSLVPELGRRLSLGNCKGYCVSNWGSNNLEAMQRNGILYDLIYGYFATNGQNSPDDFERLDALTRQELYNLIGGEQFTGEIVHSTQADIKHRFFYDGHLFRKDDFYMGDHILEDENGNKYRLPVYFGTNISNANVKPGRFMDPNVKMERYARDMQYIEVSGAAFAEVTKDGKLQYRCRFNFPGRQMHYLRFEPANAFIPQVHFISLQ